MQAPILELKNIGKIYVSEGNVTVGIRGVNLSFERGEFVAVTGKSGSGKSTLLGVISGMDTYEEGELYVEGEPTSHFMQKDWEEYRKQYISFIFQDYNILESFTVLQNVELALMHIDCPRERRARALELLRRVGLEGHIHHKGSKLSGGQKQRTVIARALAKDSPILLCDEPTGNLDSKTSEEIISLLREVSKDKLVIIVTHNFEQVEAYATRHIRIYDGAVDRDQVLILPEPTSETAPAAAPKASKGRFLSTLRNGLQLGRVRFFATPKLSVFLCILMTLSALVITLVTAFFPDMTTLFDEPHMFNPMKGRTVIVRSDGGVMTEMELTELAHKVGADQAVRYDYLLDKTTYLSLDGGYNRTEFACAHTAMEVRPHVGRRPEADHEVILEVPLSYKTDIEKDGFAPFDLELLFGMGNFTVVGVLYRVDNTVTPCIHFTEYGYRVATAMMFFSQQPPTQFTYQGAVTVQHGEKPAMTLPFTMQSSTYVDFGLPADVYFVNYADYQDGSGQVTLTLNGAFTDYSYGVYDPFYGEPRSYGEQSTVSVPFDAYTHRDAVSPSMIHTLEMQSLDTWESGVGLRGSTFVVISPAILLHILEDHYYEKVYTQASLFFGSDMEAHTKVEKLRSLGYTAVVSDEKVEETDVLMYILEKLVALMQTFGWLMTLLFTTLFMILCSSRAMNATKGDVAIMRSMGIPTRVVKLSIHIQTFISLIPAFVVTALVMTTLYVIPQTNAIFHFLHLGDYATVSLVMLVVTWFLSRRYVRKMFKQSVKKTMKGGAAS